MNTHTTPTERHQALIRLTERHSTGTDRTRWNQSGIPLSPHDAVRRVNDLAAGSITPAQGEPATDEADLTDALTLLPHARAEFDQMELGLLTMAKGRGMTWQNMGHHLGLGSAQAARQRHERLTKRLDT